MARTNAHGETRRSRSVRNLDPSASPAFAEHVRRAGFAKAAPPRLNQPNRRRAPAPSARPARAVDFFDGRRPARPYSRVSYMANKMLIDATHPEETRVVVVRGSRVEEFDFESANRKQLRGNIYLAKVTRVEPSLQAAFVEYGGNRHGFLAFSEIHPDYYQIPVADRQALIAEDEKAHAEEEAAEEKPAANRRRRSRARPK
ncbi:hypothetical protein ACIKTA_15930, partial [Hansschlegelia beijingensis]